MSGISKALNIRKKDLARKALFHDTLKKRRGFEYFPLLACLLIIISGCSTQYAYWNHPKTALTLPYATHFTSAARHATFKISDDRGNQDVLVMLALSGGGSRAAYLAARVMTTLQHDPDLDILKEVDVISSVSGGSLAGAYYAVTEDPEFVIPSSPLQIGLPAIQWPRKNCLS